MMSLSADQSCVAVRRGARGGPAWAFALAAGSALLVGGASPVHAQQLGRPGAAATRPARQPQDIEQELGEVSQALAEATPSMDVLFDPVKRKEFAPKALPLLNRMVDLY